MRPIGKAHELWFGPDAESAVPVAEDDFVWVIVGTGRKRLVKRSVAEAEGWKIDDTPPRGFGATGFGGSNYRLKPEERERLFTQTGEHFDSHDQYKSWCRANGKRDVERGEPADVHRRDMDEWYKSGCSGPEPHRWTGGGRRRNRTAEEILGHSID